ncbi:hypothetical protein [Azospirillum sp. BE72]|uniref:hypothetical protein n=1 Tax=Azospirillum sp. BE72 TaxID=2817776 RepID=UPI002856C21E|nr:hypothetical protein [Azospirillum sp. BE72]MDR6771815.1 hypothetical protein [Azospirillum sp. BE72]
MSRVKKDAGRDTPQRSAHRGLDGFLLRIYVARPVASFGHGGTMEPRVETVLFNPKESVGQ